MIHSCKVFFSFWMNISFNCLRRNQDEVVLLGGEDGPKAEHQLPLQTDLDLLWFLPLWRCPQDLTAMSLCSTSAGWQRYRMGKFGCNKQETTSSLLWLLAESDLPVQHFGGLPSVGTQAQAAQRLRSRKVPAAVIPEVKQHESRQS